MKTSRDPLFHSLLREHRAKVWLPPCGTVLLAALLSLTVQGILLPRLFQGNPAKLFHTQLAAALLLISAGIIFAALLLHRTRRSPAATAAELDAEAHAKNRLEAAWELRNTDHILKHDLMQDARDAYREYRFSRRPLGLNLCLAGLCLLLAGNLLLLAESRAGANAVRQEKSSKQKTVLPNPGQQTKNNPPDEQSHPEKMEHAALLLTLPESEQRAKPLDEIEWEGTGSSVNGFTKLVLTVSVNGTQRCELKPDTPAEQPGEIKTGGFLALEDLDVKPFDLVSIHLTGITRIHGKATEILSTPRFIEVRPFREDTLVLNADAVSGETVSLINLFLAIQMDLNKALFRIRILQKQSAGQKKQLKEAIRGLEQEQQKLSSDLEQFLNSEEARRIPADAVNHLEKSLESMKKSCLELKGSLQP